MEGSQSHNPGLEESRNSFCKEGDRSGSGSLTSHGWSHREITWRLNTKVNIIVSYVVRSIEGHLARLCVLVAAGKEQLHDHLSQMLMHSK